MTESGKTLGFLTKPARHDTERAPDVSDGNVDNNSLSSEDLINAKSFRLVVGKFGNSYGIVLPKDLLLLLDAAEGDAVTAVASEGCVTLRAIGSDTDDAAEWIEKGARRYKRTLSALAK